MGGKGVWVGIAIAAPLALILGLVLLLGGGSSIASSTGLTAGMTGGAALNASAIPDQSLVPWIEKAGSLCPQVSAPVIAAQIDAESGWDPTAVSSTGAQGLSQFGPATWPAYGQDDAGDGNVSPFNPPDAIMAQGRFDCALASAVAPIAASSGVPVLTLILDAYNAGLGAVIAANGVPHNAQTQAYAPKIESLAAAYTAPTASLVSTGSGQFAQVEISAATAEMGRPYVWGGGASLGPSGSASAPAGFVGQPGFDCSGLVLYAVFQASQGSISLPHSSEIQATMGQDVGTGTGAQVLGSGQLQPGDDIAFQMNGGGDYDHIGIYIGNGEMVAAPSTGDVVQIQNLNTSYWLALQWSARRFG